MARPNRQHIVPDVFFLQSTELQPLLKNITLIEPFEKINASASYRDYICRQDKILHWMNTMKSTCMNCKFYKIEDTMSGYCRVKVRETGDKDSPRPMVRQDDFCSKWVDCGQQYYIRLGWVRSQDKQNESNRRQ